ncbi:hypothetical protein NKH85_12490 [Mesorhizobium sp. M0924]|uniref:hypothetical protein n=1 Tax=unclassified Mesorhizobium TaxID=325217 RepID=UPI00333B262C
MLAPRDIKPLSEKIVGSFSESEFDRFLITDFNGLHLADYAPSGEAWPVRAVVFIIKLVNRERDAEFLSLLAGHAGPVDPLPGPNQPLRDMAAALLAAALPPQEAHRPCFVNGRLFINRDSLWGAIAAFPASQGAQRILLVDGDPGTGKSYSAQLVSQSSSHTRARYIPIDLARSTAPEAGLGELTAPLAVRLELALKQKFDDLAQEARDVLRAGERLVAALQEREQSAQAGTVPEPWWILVDGLNLPRVGPGIIDLVLRLVQAIDQGECNNVWLVLIGLKPERLTGALPQLVRVDRSSLPLPDHVEEWLLRLVQEHKSQPADPDLAEARDSLRQTFAKSQPVQQFWPSLLAALAAVRAKLQLVP